MNPKKELLRSLWVSSTAAAQIASRPASGTLRWSEHVFGIRWRLLGKVAGPEPPETHGRAHPHT